MKIIATNKKATFDYQISLKFDAGIVLTGPEVKSLRNNSSSIKESYIEDNGGELWLCNCYIKKYESSNEKDHNPSRKRKLLLNKNELKKLMKETINSSNTIIPLKLFINEKGLAKIEISLAKGKKLYDKRETIKDRENKRDLDRLKKIKNKK